MNRPVLVLSQVPPPVHGSTVMTKVFLSQLAVMGEKAVFVDKRFSREIGEVGKVSVRKALSALGLFGRLVAARLRSRCRTSVVFLTNRPGSFLVDAVCVFLLRLGGGKVVHYVHTSGFTKLASRSPIWKILVTLTFRDTTIVTLGESLVRDLDGLHVGETHAIPNIPLDPPARIVEQRTNTVLFLSNLLPEKGADVFLEVATLLDTSVNFIIAGPAPDEEFSQQLRYLAEEKGIADRVVFLGYVDANMKWELLARSGCLLFPSRYAFEAQPLTLVESRWAGLRAVATDVGGIRDLCDDSGWLDVVPEADAESLAAAVSAQLRRLARPDYAFSSVDGADPASAYRAAWSSILR